MQIDYDPAKNIANIRKHGIDLEDAILVLYDPRALVREDTDSEAEQRLVAVGLGSTADLLTVVYTYRPPDRIRLISARQATKKERRCYED